MMSSRLRKFATFFAIFWCGNAFPQTAPISAPQQSIQMAVAAAAESVVRIETVGGVDLVDDLLTATGPTTGVIIRADGLIITSRFNFLSTPSSILVTLPDGRKFAARVAGEDRARMLTLLKIEAKELKPVIPAPRREVRVGQTAIALGRTFDLAFPNVSSGIISAVDRVWGRALQTDAKTSPVNYGGPLLDLAGRCLGVIVPLDPSQEEATAGVEWYDSGIGFAIPCEDILLVLDRLAAGENLKRGLMGINFEDKGPLSGEARVVHVRPGSPAAQAGLVAEDVIIQINGRPVSKVNDLKHAVGPLYAGEVARLRIRRGDQERDLQLTLTDELRPYQFPFAGFLPERTADGPPRVRAVIPGSPSEQAGLRAGDLIEQLAGEPVPSRAELAARILRRSPGESLVLAVKRGEETLSITLKLAPWPATSPENIRPASIPANPLADRPATGRISEKLPGSESSFWAFVPENYHPGIEWGLLIWLHPHGDGMEAETQRTWEAVSRERGLILLGPRADDVNAWNEDDGAAIEKMVEWLRGRYRIDPARVAVLGYETSTPFAARLAFRERDLVRSLILIRGGFRSPPPENDPNTPLHFALVPGSESQRKALTEIHTALKELQLPAVLYPDAPKEKGNFAPDLVESLSAWLDALDRS